MSERRRRYLEVGAVLAGLLLLAGLRWWRELAGWAAFGAEDIPVLNLPVRAYFGDYLRRGVLVLFTPLLQGGFPVFAESQAGPTYPLKVLHALPVAHWTILAWTVVIHLAWAGTGLYAYLRTVGVRPQAALLPAIGLALGAHLVVRHQHTNVLEALSWWPWVLTGVELTVRWGGSRRWLGCGLAIGLMAMCGHVQFVFYGGLLGIGYGLTRLATIDDPQGWRHLGELALALLTAGGLAAAQYVPLLELTGNSLRAQGSGEQLVSFGLRHVPLFCSPNFWGPMFDPRYFKPALRWEATGYVGLLTLLLAYLGSRQARPLARTWLAIGGLGLLCACGHELGVYTVLSTFVGGNSFRVPARLLSWAVMALAVLAGLGAEAVYDRRIRWSPAWTVAAVAGPAALLLAAIAVPVVAEKVLPGAGAPARAALLIAAGLAMGSFLWLWQATSDAGWRPVLFGICLMVCDVIVTSLPLTPSQSPPKYLDPPTPPTGRVAVGAWRYSDLWWFQPVTNLMTRADNLHNMSPLSLRLLVELQEQAALRSSWAYWRVMALLGVDAYAPTLESARLEPTPLPPLPRAWAPNWVETHTTVEHVTEGVLDPLFDPRHTALIIGPPATRPAGDGAASIRLTASGPNRQVYTCQATGDRFWVLNTTPYPGRVAAADGRLTRVVPTNLVHCGVWTRGAGQHRIVLTFDSLSIRVGRFVTLLTLAAMAAVIAAGWGRHRD